MNHNDDDLDIDIVEDTEDDDNSSQILSAIQTLDESRNELDTLTASELESLTQVSEFQWQQQNIPCFSSSDMDAATQEMIEKMLQEEEYYFGQSSMNFPSSSSKAVHKNVPRTSKESNRGSISDEPVAKKVGKKVVPKPKLSSADLPSHKTRWTDEEDAKLEEGIEKYGYGNWKIIAKFIGTRNSLQVKNHARHLFGNQKEKYDSDSKPRSRRKSSSSAAESIQAPVTTVKPEVLETDEAIAFKDEHTSSQKPTENEVAMKVEEEDEDIEIDIDIDDGSDIAAALIPTSIVKDEIIESFPIAATPCDEHPTIELPDAKPKSNSNQLSTVSRGRTISTSSQKSISDRSSHRSTSASSSLSRSTVENSIKLQSPSPNRSRSRSPTSLNARQPAPPSPPRPTVLSPMSIDPHEKYHNPEFFLPATSLKSANKTPARYLKIRNHILDMWQQAKPKYLTKTKVRPGLKNCGDVNAIGRVHGYLEWIGMINEGCDEVPIKSRLSKEKDGGKGKEFDGEVFDGDDVRWNEIHYGPRKRRVRNATGEWVDPSELEGATIDHFAQAQDVADLEGPRLSRAELLEEIEMQRLDAMNARWFAEGEIQDNELVPKTKRATTYLKKRQRTDEHHHHHHSDPGDEYDPFRLIPLKDYTSEIPPPFKVSISSNAVLLLDFHSYLSATEIIGLLGGTYNSTTKTLHITTSFPCRSISTGVQCEMDPESEMKAREVFSSKGLIVVGWYHSHPNFETNPSIRDLENQACYQTLFEHPDETEPFIGIIVSPYNLSYPSDTSEISYLSVGRQFHESGLYRLPYKCDKTIIPGESLPTDLLKSLMDLVAAYKNYPHRVDLSAPYRRGEPTTKLDKLLKSLASWMFVSDALKEAFLRKVRDMIVTGFDLENEINGSTIL